MLAEMGEDLPVVWRHREGNVHGIWDIIYAPKFKVPSDYYALDECFEITGETPLPRA